MDYLGISSKVLKSISKTLSAPFVEIVNCMLREGIFPGRGKLARICTPLKETQ